MLEGSKFEHRTSLHPHTIFIYPPNFEFLEKNLCVVNCTLCSDSTDQASTLLYNSTPHLISEGGSCSGWLTSKGGSLVRVVH